MWYCVMWYYEQSTDTQPRYLSLHITEITTWFVFVWSSLPRGLIFLPWSFSFCGRKMSIFVTTRGDRRVKEAVKSWVRKVCGLLTCSWHHTAKCPCINHTWDNNENQSPLRKHVQMFDPNHISSPVVLDAWVTLLGIFCCLYGEYK